jgi:hypothetical protein
MQLNVLTREELYILTRYKRKAEQKQWLKDNGIFFLEASDGSPSVSVERVNAMLGVDIGASIKKKPTLDLDAIKSYGKINGSKNQKKQ